MERSSHTFRVKRQVRQTPEFQALWQSKETRTEWEPRIPAPRVAPAPLATTTPAYVSEVSRSTRPVSRPAPQVSFARGSNGASNPLPRVVRPPEPSSYGYSRPLPKSRHTTTEPISVEPVVVPDVRYIPESRYTSENVDDPALYQYDELSNLIHQMDSEIQRTKSQGLRVARRVITEPTSRPRRNSDPTNGTETSASRNISVPSSIGAEHSRSSSVVHTPSSTSNESKSTTRESSETKPKSRDSSEAKSKTRESSETKPKRERSIESESTPKTKADSKATTQREETEAKATTQKTDPEPPTQEESTVVNTPSPPRTREADEEPLQGSSSSQQRPLEPKVKAEPSTKESVSPPSSSTKQTITTEDDDEDATKPQTTEMVSPSFTSVITAHRKSNFTDAGYLLVAVFIALYAARLGYNNIDNLVWLWKYRSWFNIPIV